MSEALVIGVVGTVLGVGLGFGMAQGLLRLVTRTINDLYFVLSVREVILDPMTLAKSVLLGIGATALAALPPALEATAAPPRVVMSRASLESSARRRAHRAGWLGLVALAAGALILAVPGSIVVGFVGLLVLMVGCALVTPAAALGLLHPLHRVAGCPNTGKDDSIRSCDFGGIAGNGRAHAEPLESISDRTDIAVGEVDDGEPHRTPLVLGTTSPSVRVCSACCTST